MDQFLSKCQCGFRKGFNAQQCLFVKLENWKKAVDPQNVFGALLTDYSVRKGGWGGGSKSKNGVGRWGVVYFKVILVSLNKNFKLEDGCLKVACRGYNQIP